MKLTRKIINVVYCLIVIFVILIPLYLCFINAFKENSQVLSDFIGLPNSIDLSNFKYLIEERSALKYTLNSLVITVVVAIIITIINPFMAYKMAINWDNKVFKYTYFILSSAMFVPSQVLFFPLIKELYLLNLMNPGGLIIYYAVFMIPESIFLLVPYFRLFKRNLREAAYLDGSRELNFYLRVFLPVCRPAITAVTILCVVWTWNDFFMPLMILNKNPDWWTQPIFMYNFMGTFSNTKNLAFSAIQLAVFPIFVFYLLFHERIIAGLSRHNLQHGGR